MADVATATTADADQTRAAGSRILGYYLGSGGVKVDALHDVANFVTKNADGRVSLGGAAYSYLLNLAAGAAPRGVVTDFNTSGNVGAMISFTQAGITNNCFGTIPGTGDFGWYVNRTGVADGVLLMRLTSAGNLGIGTSSPQARLHVSISDNEIMRMGTMGGNCYQTWYDENLSIRMGYCGFFASQWVISVEKDWPIRFDTNSTPRWFIENTGHFIPASDATYNFGWASGRIQNIYISNSPIVTSDAREKTWRGAPTSAELTAARRIAAELGFYQWNDAIAEKGEDGARLHFGVRAQAVWAIMADEGLIDPITEGVRPDCRYAFLCYDDWPEIEAVEEVRDEEDNIITPASPARPAGNRFGVRTDQLALFLIAAQEARLSALEAVS